MLQPLATRPAVAPTPALGAFSAPPGVKAGAVAAAPDHVSLATCPAECPEAVKPSRSWLRIGLLAAAAVAGTAGMMSLVQSPPPAPSVVKTVESAPAAKAPEAPVTIAQEDCACGEANPEIASTRIGAPTTRPFTGEKLSLDTQSGVSTKTTETGKNLEFRWTHTSLVDAHTGDSYAADDLTGSEEAFMQQAGEDWKVHATMDPAGNTGRFASVVVKVGGQLTEGQSTERATFRTYDRETGNQVRMDEILAPHDMESVLELVQGRLNRADAAAYRHDAESLKEFVNQSFTVGEQDGRTTLTVGIPQAQPGSTAQVLEIAIRLAPGVQL